MSVSVNVSDMFEIELNGVISVLKLFVNCPQKLSTDKVACNYFDCNADKTCGCTQCWSTVARVEHVDKYHQYKHHRIECNIVPLVRTATTGACTRYTSFYRSYRQDIRYRKDFRSFTFRSYGITELMICVMD